MKIYEYAIIHHPLATKAQHEAGQSPRSELLVDVKRVLAASEKEAQMIAARDIPEAYLSQLDRVEIALRPF